jgi:hypothetical protein
MLCFWLAFMVILQDGNRGFKLWTLGFCIEIELHLQEPLTFRTYEI